METDYEFGTDYEERVYAGVLGKIIGVYLGRPFEGWSNTRIEKELGDIRYYVHETLKQPLVVTDDDISGTFTFLRALPDYGNSRDITAEQIGQTWLNYLIEKRTILWWGGMGMSTEHTAFLRLKHGIKAPESGSIKTNGKVVAEQIGAQIFIDGWGMVCPGQPDLAAELARKAASVSHDGEAIYGAVIVAVMESLAFVEQDLETLLDAALAYIPSNSVIAKMIGEIRGWHKAEPNDWRKTYAKIAENYGYDKFGGNCHMVPNHALIILALLYGGGDFSESLCIVNTAGWDTDCNSANVGCLLGIRGGLAGLDSGADWRTPVADRMMLPTSDGGRCITDALAEAYHVVNIGRALANLEPVAPKDGARFHFSLPGSVQGWRVSETNETTKDAAMIRNEDGSLAIYFLALATGRAVRVTTPTFIPPDALGRGGYELLASPTLYSGQRVTANLSVDRETTRSIEARLFVNIYGAEDKIETLYGASITLNPGAKDTEFHLKIPDTEGSPICEIGLELLSASRAEGRVFIDSLTWYGAPDLTLKLPTRGGKLWRKAWVNGMSQFGEGGGYTLVQDEETGLLIQGTREWTDYKVSATVTPNLAKSFGIAARVQGMKRYYALLLTEGNRLQLVKARDGDTVLAEQSFDWAYNKAYEFVLEVQGERITASLGGVSVFDVMDASHPLKGGGVAFVLTEGRVNADAMRVKPL